jgi:hypothetical protein
VQGSDVLQRCDDAATASSCTSRNDSGALDTGATSDASTASTAGTTGSLAPRGHALWFMLNVDAGL